MNNNIEQPVDISQYTKEQLRDLLATVLLTLGRLEIEKQTHLTNYHVITTRINQLEQLNIPAPNNNTNEATYTNNANTINA